MRAWIVSAVVTAATIVCAQPALADSQYSANWAGYAVHRNGVSFRQVSGTWKQPTVSCTAGSHSYSAYWVGLGGYSATSNALEQIGTEADCNSQGAPVLSAWYEYLPYAVSINMPIRPGDTITAGVAVSGRRITLTLDDVTRGKAFSKALNAGGLDVSSAEWIVEAPSQCFGASSCTILPLADFGGATFTGASAQAAGGHVGSISDPAWGATKLDLSPNGRPFAATASGTGVAAVASPLRPGGDSFRVAFAHVALQFGNHRAVARAAGGPAPKIRVMPRR